MPARVEVIPTGGIVAKVRETVPLASTLTVNCPADHGLGSTMQTAIRLARLGYRVVPHIAARSLEDRPQLAGLLRQYQLAGITEVLAVTGDAPHAAGRYDSDARLMEDIAEITGGSIAIGAAGYPEGHPGQDTGHMLASLLEKQHLATNVVTQMCFSAAKIGQYIELLRREGVDLPIWAGVAGSLPPAKLVPLAHKVGVGTSLRLLGRKGPLGRRLLSGDRYSPRRLMSELSAFRPAPAGIHLRSFNYLDPYTIAGGTASAASTPPANYTKGDPNDGH